MKITQSTLRKVIQEEIEKVREAPTSDMGEMVDRASAQVDLLLARFMKYAEAHPEIALEMFDEIKKLHDEYVKKEEPQGDEDYRMVDPVELTRRAQEEEEANYIERIMGLDPTQDEDALQNMDIDELEERELLLRRRAER